MCTMKAGALGCSKALCDTVILSNSVERKMYGLRTPQSSRSIRHLFSSLVIKTECGWYRPAIPELGRQEHEENEFKASLDQVEPGKIKITKTMGMCPFLFLFCFLFHQLDTAKVIREEGISVEKMYPSY